MLRPGLHCTNTASMQLYRKGEGCKVVMGGSQARPAPQYLLHFTPSRSPVLGDPWIFSLLSSSILIDQLRGRTGVSGSRPSELLTALHRIGGQKSGHLHHNQRPPATIRFSCCALQP